MATPTLSPATLPPALSSKRSSQSRPSTAVSAPLSQTSSTVASRDDPFPGDDEDDDDANSQFHREAYGPEPGEKGWDQYEVRFAPNDPEDPHNWSRVQRWYITLLGGLLVLNAYVCMPSIPLPISDRSMQYIREFSTIWHCTPDDGKIRVWPRGRNSYHCTFRRRLLCWSARLGTVVGAIRPSVALADRVPGIHRVPDRMRTLAKYRVDPHLPVLGWLFRCSAASHQRVSLFATLLLPP